MSKPRNLQTAPKKNFSRIVLLCTATAIAFSFYYWSHRETGTKNPSQQNTGVVRHKINHEEGTTPLAQTKINDADRQDPNIRDTPKQAAPNLDQPSAQLSDDQQELTTRNPRASVEKIEQSADEKVFSEKPEYSDAQPPTLNSITFDPAKAPTGTNVLVYVSARDNLSGVHSVTGRAKSPSGTAVVRFNCEKSQDDGSFVGVIKIPDRAETGTWSIASLRITDKVNNAGNYSEKDPVLRRSHFEVVGTDSDNIPPTVVKIHLEPYEVQGGDTVLLVVEAEDDQSAVARIQGSLSSPSNNARLTIACKKSETNNLFTGQTRLPTDAESGEWILNHIWAEDEAKNAKTYHRHSYSELFEQATVRVYTEGSDAQPPALDDLAITPASIAYGEYVEIVVSASDDISGISRVRGRLRSPSGKAIIPFSCAYEAETDTYRATVTIKSNSEVGIWTVDFIRTVDKARNEKVYGHQNALVAEAAFEVTGKP